MWWRWWRRLMMLMVLSPLACNGEAVAAIYTTGSHFTIGQDIGREFSRQIKEYLTLHSTLNAYLIPFSETDEGKLVVLGYQNALKQFHPELIDEMLGMAVGAEVDFDLIFLINICYELSMKRGSNDGDPDILVYRPDLAQVFMVHNVDTSPLVRNRGYMVHAQTVNKQGKLTRFSAFCYPGELPGRSFGFNQYGLAFTLNSLHPATVLENKICKSFLGRALLEAGSVEQAREIMERAGGVGVAYGFSVNVMDMKAGQQAIWNFEVAPSPDGEASIVDAYQVDDNSSYFHVNSYRRIQTEELANRLVSSNHRSDRIAEMGDPLSVQDALNILGDKTNRYYPIYRKATRWDHSCTIATALLNAITCELSIYRDNPKNSDPIDVLPIKCCNKDIIDCLSPPPIA